MVMLCRIGDILLSTAVTQNTGLGRAVYVEDCSCPTGYTGLSCEVTRPHSYIAWGGGGVDLGWGWGRLEGNKAAVFHLLGWGWGRLGVGVG